MELICWREKDHEKVLGNDLVYSLTWLILEQNIEKMQALMAGGCMEAPVLFLHLWVLDDNDMIHGAGYDFV